MTKSIREIEQAAIRIQALAQQINLAAMETVAHVKLNGVALEKLKQKKD